METSARRPGDQGPREWMGGPLRVVALYDGFVPALLAHEALGAVSLRVRPHWGIDSSIYSFDMVAAAEIDSTAGIDMIIVAVPGDRPLPDHIKVWMHACLQKQGTRRPVIKGIYGQHPDMGKSPLSDELGMIAAKWGALLWCNGELDARFRRGLCAGVPVAELNRGMSGSALLHSYGS